jgi:restriction system protein
VVADAFRRHGYKVREVRGRGRADGGVDLVLVRNGESTVVQVKHWRRDVVGVSLVRELYGVQRASAAASAIFVTMGRFSSDAIAFADQVGMTLVDGPELLRIGADLADMPFEVPLTIDTSVPTCPACGADMVERTAGRGAHAFPARRATRPLDAEPSAPADLTERVRGHRAADQPRRGDNPVLRTRDAGSMSARAPPGSRR